MSWSIELNEKLDEILASLNGSAGGAKQHQQACEQCQANKSSGSKADAW